MRGFHGQKIRAGRAIVLLCVLAATIAIPGLAGYAGGRSEAYGQIKRELQRLRAQMREAETRIRTVLAEPCLPATALTAALSASWTLSEAVYGRPADMTPLPSPSLPCLPPPTAILPSAMPTAMPAATPSGVVRVDVHQPKSGERQEPQPSRRRPPARPPEGGEDEGGRVPPLGPITLAPGEGPAPSRVPRPPDDQRLPR